MTETKTIRVRPVEGRLARDEVSRQPITEEVEVPDTRFIRRRIADGDLELVGGDDANDAGDARAAREADPRGDVNEAWGIAPRPDPNADVSLTDEERRALREAGRL